MARPRKAPIRLRQVVAHREQSTGRFTSRKRGTAKETYMMQVGPSGKIRRVTEVLGRHRVVKTARVDGPRGSQPGNLFWALARTNIYTTLKGAKHITATVTGRDFREKSRRIKVDIDTRSVKKNLGDLMLGKILGAMRARGFRSQYNVDEVKFTRRNWTKSKARKLKQLHDVTVVVELRK